MGELVILLAQLYLALTGVIVGFAMMLGGPLLARRALAFMIVRPVRGLLYRVGAGTSFALWRLRLAIGRALAALGRFVLDLLRAFVRYVIDPMARFLVRVLDMVLAGRR